ncbi:MAG: hypothetical protein ABII00_11125 [Elusimicrobiota bacterium]
MSVFLALSFFSLAALPASAGSVSIQRYLESLKLGDGLKQIEIVYPPQKKWPKYTEPGGKIVRIEVERGFAKYFPAGTRTIRLRLRRDRLVHIQVIYDKEQSRRKPLDQLVVDLALIYGEPRRAGETYFWWDSGTVVAASYAEVLSGEGEGKALRTSLELMERPYFAY